MLQSHPDRILQQHLLDVESAAMAILDRHLPDAFSRLQIDCRYLLQLLSGWHDIAKATSFFQHYITDMDDWNRRVSHGDASNAQKTHTPLGALLAADYFAANAPEQQWFVPLLMTLAIRGHHSRLPTMKSLYESFTQNDDLLEEQAECLSPDITATHHSLTNSLDRLDSQEFDGVYDSTMRLIEEDWPEQLAAFPVDKLVRVRLAVQFCFSCLLEADKALLIHPTLEAYFGATPRPYPATLVEDNIPTANADDPINPKRRAAYELVISDPQKADLWDFRPRVLTLPTGLGKTRCAAGWAMHWRSRLHDETGVKSKIIVVLPFLSVIEQTAGVYRDLLQLKEHSNDIHLQTSHSLSLRDHMDVETESLGGDAKDDARSQAEFMLDTWRSEIVLTTFDQFLLALMDAKSRHQQRFHNLCDALIIIDEVQAFPVHLWDPVGTLLTELANVGNSRFLLMTATQPGIIPESDRLDLIPQPRTFAQPRYRMEIDLIEQPLSQWLVTIADEIAANPQIKKWLLVFNTRRCAQDVFRYLQNLSAEWPHELMLLSSDIVPRDRLARIERIKNCDACIAVTTQCVEAGVDIDMDLVIRDFAPLDSLVQVAGRCNRNGMQDRQSVRIVRLLNELPDGTVHKAFGDYIYDSVSLSTSAELLRESPFVNEEDVTDLVQRYFAELAQKKDKGAELTQQWARFQHDDIDIQYELRGDNSRQISFVVEKLDPTIRSDIATAYEEKNRWKRRRRLRDLGPRIAQITVTAWLNQSFRPEDVAEPFPCGETPSFWFLSNEFYEEDDVGLCLTNVPNVGFF